MTDPIKKQFELEDKKKQALQVYFFTAQQGPMRIEVLEDVHAYLAYDEPTALGLIAGLYPKGKPISIRKRASMPVEHILKQVNTGEAKVDIANAVAPIETKKITEHNFIYGMMLVADQYVTEQRDRTSLKRIINKVLKQYENKQTTEPKKSTVGGSKRSSTDSK